MWLKGNLNELLGIYAEKSRENRKILLILFIDFYKTTSDPFPKESNVPHILILSHRTKSSIIRRFFSTLFTSWIHCNRVNWTFIILDGIIAAHQCRFKWLVSHERWHRTPNFISTFNHHLKKVLDRPSKIK